MLAPLETTPIWLYVVAILGVLLLVTLLIVVCLKRRGAKHEEPEVPDFSDLILDDYDDEQVQILDAQMRVVDEQIG